MIRTQLTIALTTAGVNRIIYESAQLANVAADESLHTETIGIILEPNDLVFKTGSNGVQERYNLTVVEIVKQVQPEDTAINNEATLIALKDICKAFLNSLIHSQSFQKIPDVSATKVTERRYDANVIGWAMTIDLQPINNITVC